MVSGKDVIIENGVVHIYTRLIDVNKGVKTIIKELEGKQLLENLVLSYLNLETEEYKVIYPENADKVYQLIHPRDVDLENL